VALARKSLDQALLAPELSDPEHCWRGCNGEEAIGLEILKKIKEKKVYVFSFITTPNDTPYNTSPQHSSSGPLYITKPASSKDRSVFEGYGEQSAVKLVVCERTTVQDGCQCIVVIGDAMVKKGDKDINLGSCMSLRSRLFSLSVWHRLRVVQCLHLLTRHLDFRIMLGKQHFYTD
jgi:hypothetical protein